MTTLLHALLKRSLPSLVTALLLAAVSTGVVRAAVRTDGNIVLKISVQSSEATQGVQAGQKNVPLFAFTATAMGEEITLYHIATVADQGKLSFADNYRLWVDENGDGSVESMAQESGEIWEDLLEFENFFSKGYVIPAGKTVRFEVHGDIASSPETTAMRMAFHTLSNFYLMAKDSGGSLATGITTNGTCKSAPCHIEVELKNSATIQLSGTTTPRCSETDGGYDTSAKGTTTIGKITKTDFCDGQFVVEHDCAEWSEKSQPTRVSKCPGSCSNGACITAVGQSEPQKEGPWRCVDSDVMASAPDGKNIGAQGSITLQDWDLLSDIKYDYCDGKTLWEYYCDGKAGALQAYTCSNTCQEGRCVLSTDPTMCTETDGGLDEFKKGTVATREPQSKVADGADVCMDSTSLKEFTCVRGGIIDTVTIECAHGCSEGACKQGSNEYRNGAVYCSDTDGGAVAMKKGTVTVEDSKGKKSSNTDYCGSGFQKDSINEFRCEAPGQYSTFVWSCVHGCRDGACLPGPTPYQAISQPVVAEPPAGFEKEVTTENPFTDIDPKTEKGKAALYLYEHAIAGGYPDGEFKGWRLVNRAEASKFLLNGLGITTNLSLKNDSRFSDVQEREWYVPYVIESANRGIVKGDDGKQTFRPADGVNTAEFLAMLVRTFELETGLPHQYNDVGDGDWYRHFAGIASKYGLFVDRGGYLLPEKALTRDEVAMSIMKIHQNFNK